MTDMQLRLRNALAEIQTRQKRARGKDDTVVRRYARVAAIKNDIPALVAALEVAVHWIEIIRDESYPVRGANVIQKIEEALNK